MGTPTRFTHGVTTAKPGSVLGNFPLPDPFNSGGNSGLSVAVYQNDFLKGVGEFTVTGTSSTFALQDGVGGQAILTPGATTTATSAYKTATCVQFVAGQRLWFASRFQLSAIDTASLSAYVGLQLGSAVTDGLWFAMASSTSTLDLVSTVGSTATTLVSGVATLTAATDVSVGLFFNGEDLEVYANGDLVSRILAPSIGASATKLTSKVLGPVLQITPTATQTVTADYILAAMEVSRG